MLNTRIPTIFGFGFAEQKALDIATKKPTVSCLIFSVTNSISPGTVSLLLSPFHQSNGRRKSEQAWVVTKSYFL